MFVGVDTSILHHALMLIFIALWAVSTLHGTLLMPFLSYFARFMSHPVFHPKFFVLQKSELVKTFPNNVVSAMSAIV